MLNIAHQNPLLSVAQKAHTMPTTQTILSTRETRVRGVLCLAPIGRLACTTTPSSRSFYSALRSIRQSNNVDESCIKDGPDAAVRAIRVIGLASRNATRLSSSPLPYEFIPLKTCYL